MYSWKPFIFLLSCAIFNHHCFTSITVVVFVVSKLLRGLRLQFYCRQRKVGKVGKIFLIPPSSLFTPPTPLYLSLALLLSFSPLTLPCLSLLPHFPLFLSSISSSFLLVPSLLPLFLFHLFAFPPYSSLSLFLTPSRLLSFLPLSLFLTPFSFSSSNSFYYSYSSLYSFLLLSNSLLPLPSFSSPAA